MQMHIIYTSLVNFRVCNANSRVGDKIRPLAPDLAVCVLSFSNIGIRKAAVFPLPVLAIATTSFPSIIKGTVWNRTSINHENTYLVYAAHQIFINMELE